MIYTVKVTISGQRRQYRFECRADAVNFCKKFGIPIKEIQEFKK